MNMARILITGASDGLGQMAAQRLIAEGHAVVLHARNATRAEHAMQQAPGAEAVFSADLSSIAETRQLAGKLNASGHFDAVIHNAAVGYQEPERLVTADGLPHVLAVNTLAPYILTALMARPQRLIYISSVLHHQGNPSLEDLTWEQQRWDGTQAYSDSKLHMVLLAKALARHWPQVFANSVEPGWVATKMGGPNATGDLSLAPRTQAWLAAGSDPATHVTGGYFYHQSPAKTHPAAANVDLQDAFLSACAALSGVEFPASSPSF
jgi:NAD(P)-dependent dehydrogenase (short-subunit alcohol dehydrogenase family)